MGIKVVRIWGAWCFCCPRDFLNLDQEVILPFLLWMWIFWLWRLFVGRGDNLFFGNKRGMGWRFCPCWNHETCEDKSYGNQWRIFRNFWCGDTWRGFVCSPHLPTEIAQMLTNKACIAMLAMLSKNCPLSFPPRQFGGMMVSGWTSSKFGLRQIFSGGIIFQQTSFLFETSTCRKNGWLKLYMLRWR